MRLPPALTAERLAVHRGRRTILRELDLQFDPGEIVHLRGPNGAGKTSLMRVLSGLSRPRSGIVHRNTAVAFVPEKVTLAPLLTVGDWLATMRRLRAEPSIDWAPRLTDSGLDPGVLRKVSSSLSKGMLQRIALIEALACSAGLLLFDEPSSGLDEQGRAWLVAAISARAHQGAAVVVTDHRDGDAAGLHADQTLEITDGGVDISRQSRVQRQVTICSRDAAGTLTVAQISEDDVDRVLRELLDAGQHIVRVGR